MCLFIFSFFHFLYFLLHQDEGMSALSQFWEREARENKIEGIERREKERGNKVAKD
jgi:hypothetical protein